MPYRPSKKQPSVRDDIYSAIEESTDYLDDVVPVGDAEDQLPPGIQRRVHNAAGNFANDFAETVKRKRRNLPFGVVGSPFARRNKQAM
jgi:hypothetical protein